jgi:hypothetical protein
LFSSGEIFSGGLDVFVFVWQGQGFLEYSPAATHPSIDVFAAHLFGCYLPSTTSVCLSKRVAELLNRSILFCLLVVCAVLLS